MSRKAKKDATNSMKRTSSVIPKRRVIIARNDLLTDDSDENPEFVQLRHPSSGSASVFLLSRNNSSVQEVVLFSDDKRSYFINDSVSSDGNLYLCTPIDPLFLVLPYLMKAERCSPLEQTLLDEEFPEIERLLNCPMNLGMIADRRGDESLNAYVYNEEKTLLWLQIKLERLISILKQKNINTSKTVSVSANFVKLDDDEDSGVNYMRYAYGMLLDYVPDELAQKFAEFIKLPPEQEKPVKRKEISSPSESNGKRTKLDDEDDYSVKSPVIKQEKKTPSAKEQKLAKAAKGSKSISSFFKKK